MISSTNNNNFIYTESSPYIQYMNAYIIDIMFHIWQCYKHGSKSETALFMLYYRKLII